MVQGMSLKAYAEANRLKYHTAYARWRKGSPEGPSLVKRRLINGDQ
jgi:hypothetical protein